MKRIEEVYREMLYQGMEKKNNVVTQSQLAQALNLSLSVVHLALKPLRKMNAVQVNQRNLKIIDIKKILYYWASIRNIDKDIIYSTRVDKLVKKIESEMPSNSIYGAYSAYKFRFMDIPADYSEVYVYADDCEEIKQRFPENANMPNLFVLKKDANMNHMTLALIFVDVWNLKEWYAKEFLKGMEEKI